MNNYNQVCDFTFLLLNTDFVIGDKRKYENKLKKSYTSGMA